MTYVPLCDFDGHFWPKKKHLFYIAVGENGQFSRYRRRFCAHHVATVQEDLAQNELLITEPAAGAVNPSMANCLSCRQPVREGGTQVFITGYPTENERKDYWGKLHDGHQLPPYLQDAMVP